MDGSLEGAAGERSRVFARQGVLVRVSWGADQTLANGMLASVRTLKGASRPIGSLTPRMLAVATAAVPAHALTTASSYLGRGFDACTAPALSTMHAWQASPYRAIGIYIGGLNRACAQPNLTSSWVGSVIGLGWNLAPLYVGRQAPCAAQSGMTSISAGSAASEGTSAANDAVARASAVGLGKGTPIYVDMEAFDANNKPCVRTVLTFLDAWTRRIRADGYVAGVYGSSASTITVMVQAAAASGFTAPDDVWFADWNGQAQASNDPWVPSTSWPDHQRIHQYAGGHTETWGGVQINIDSDFIDGAVLGTPAEGSFIRVGGLTYRIAGGAPLPVSDCSVLGGCKPMQTLSSLANLAPVPSNGTVIQAAETANTFVVAGGAALPVSSCLSLDCAAPVAINQQTITSGGSGRLKPLPIDGTVLQALPSSQLWQVNHACREPVTSGTSAVRFADADVATLFPPCIGRLVFARGRLGARQLFAMNADGTGVKQLTHLRGDASSPAISPDGSRVAFVRTLRGNADVWVMNSDGTVHRLTTGRSFDGDPAWSPNGADIAFVSARAGSKDLWTMRADGSGQHQLLSWRSTETHPTFSPDGTQIVFQSDKAGHPQVFVLRLGVGTRRLTDRPASDASPAWSPDGLRILFSSNSGGSQALWTVNTSGAPALTRLTNGAAADSAPAWSPGGLRIAFVSNVAGTPQLWAIRADGSQAVRYSRWPAPTTTPSWGLG